MRSLLLIKDEDTKFIEENLSIRFQSGHTQFIPLAAKISICKLQLDTDFMDFGIIPVGRKRDKHITIKNISNSAALYSITCKKNI